jgi:hypothetical protein
MTLFGLLTTLVANELLYQSATSVLGEKASRRFARCLLLTIKIRLKQQQLKNRFGVTTMKTNSNFRLALFAIALFLSLSAATLGNGRQSRASTSPREGFWVVESQPKQKCVVLFYNNDNQLIYKEVLAKKRLNIKQTKTRKA